MAAPRAIAEPHEQENREQAPPAKRKRSKDLLDILLEKAEDGAAEVKLTRENMKAFITVSLSVYL